MLSLAYLVFPLVLLPLLTSLLFHAPLSFSLFPSRSKEKNMRGADPRCDLNVSAGARACEICIRADISTKVRTHRGEFRRETIAIALLHGRVHNHFFAPPLPVCSIRATPADMLWTALLMLFLCSARHYNENEVTSIEYSCLSVAILLADELSFFLLFFFLLFFVR